MCGLVGMLSSRPEVTANCITRAADRIAHRGPDDFGCYINAAATAGLGFRRLSIIDLSPAGHQPMTTADLELTIVFNGEIYNYRELRALLVAKGHKFRSQSDTEVVLYGFREWGEGVLQRLRGMFAFAILDNRSNACFVARDRLGIKPLYYFLNGEIFAFASELKALLLLPGVPRRVRPASIFDYLTYRYIPTPYTAYEGILKLPPAYCARFGAGALTTRRYWSIDVTSNNDATLEGTLPRIGRCLEDAVRSHLVSDVPVGVLLSGGMDSSTIATFVRSIPAQPLHSFSLGFEGEPGDLPFAETVARGLGTVHHQRVLCWQDISTQIKTVVATYDEPFGDVSAIPTIEVSRLAAEHVKVVLSGEGGDEVFAGYHWYKQMQRFWELERWIPRPLRAIVGRSGQTLDRFMPDYSKWLRTVGSSPVEQYALNMEWISSKEKREIFQPDAERTLHDHDDDWYLKEYWPSSGAAITKMQYVDLNTYLPDQLLTKVDRASMSCSLEARVPYLDHPLVEALFATAPALRFHRGQPKFLQKQLMAERLPIDVLRRPKMGFVPPLSTWMSPAFISSACRHLANGAAVRLGLLRPDAASRLGPDQIAPKLWLLLILDEWAAVEESSLCVS